MTEQERPIWGIHAGAQGEADSLFEQGNIALGWTEMGDLRGINPNREAFKQQVAVLYPQEKPGSWPGSAGMLYRFLHEMKQGDLVLNRSKVTKMIRIGEVTGDYKHIPGARFPHQRTVKWLKTIDPAVVTQGARYELGSALSLFSIRQFADEWLDLMAGGSVPPKPVIGADDDPTVGVVAEQIDLSTRDFILSRLGQTLKGHPFAHFVAQLLNLMGYRTRVSPAGADGGVDIIAHKDELGFEPPIVKVQVKSSSGSVGQPDVSALLGTLGPGEFGLFVSLGTFTPPARSFARGKGNLRLIDQDEIVDLVQSYYEQIDDEYKRLIPMKRVYVPQATDQPPE